jgi:hypothetical protein
MAIVAAATGRSTSCKEGQRVRDGRGVGNDEAVNARMMPMIALPMPFDLSRGVLA